MDPDEIVRKVRRLSSCRLVEITGGEPLLQEQTPQLVETFLNMGYKVLLETNGSLNIDILNPLCSRIVDFKCPGSLMDMHNDWKNIDRLTSLDQVKFVICNKEDYTFAKEHVRQILGQMGSNFPVLFSPVTPVLDPKDLAQWILEDSLPVRLQLQLHKVIWGQDKRGI